MNDEPCESVIKGRDTVAECDERGRIIEKTPKVEESGSESISATKETASRV